MLDDASNSNKIVFTLMLIQLIVVVFGLDTQPCVIPTNHYLTDTTDLSEQVLAKDVPQYFGFKVPDSWNTKGNVAIPTVLFKIEYPSSVCSNSNVNVQPVVQVGANSPQLYATNSSTCSQILETVTNMTTTYQDAATNVYIQYIAIYPFEIKQYANSGVKEFAVILQQAQCSEISFYISVSYLKDVDLSQNALQTIVFPGLRQYFKFTVSDTVGSNKILFGSLQHQPKGSSVYIRVRENDYPVGEVDHLFTTDTFSIAPAPLSSTFYFYLLVPLQSDLYVQNEVQVSLIMTHGTLCQFGCGSGGVCNLTTGQCDCFNDKGFYGSDCTQSGCKDGQECSEGAASGRLKCNGPDWSQSVCIFDSCSRLFYTLDKKRNKCIRMFPVYFVASVSSGASVVALLIGLLVGMVSCHLMSNKYRRRHYHFVK